MRPGAFRIAVVVAIALVGGCAKKAARSEAPMASAGADMDAYGDGATAEEAAPARELAYTSELDELEAEFDQLDAELSSEGIPGAGERAQATAGATPKKSASTLDAAGRCERICDLKVAICDVAERICGLAEEHEDEAKYAEACTRAQDRCEQATESCDSCE